MLKDLYNALKWVCNATFYERNRNTITIKCGNGNRVYGEYRIEVTVDPEKDIRDARVNCTAGLNSRECPNKGCGYFNGHLDIKLSIEEIIYLNRMNRDGKNIDPENRPDYIEKL